MTMFGSYSDSAGGVRVLENSGRIEIASDTDSVDDLASPRKGTILESKTFRDGLIYLYRRGDYKKPTWMCRIKVPGGKGYVNRSAKTADEHQAFKFADDLYNQLLVKSLTGEAPVGKRMGPAIDAYIKRLEPQRERQSIHYKILLMQRVKPFLERKTFEELSTTILSRLVDDQIARTKKGQLSPNSVKRMFSDLKHFFNWCVEEGHLASMPRFPKVSGDKARRPHFNADEWEKLRRAMGPYLQSSPKYVQRDRLLLMHYILVLAETGIRVGEARELRWRDLRPIGNSTDPEIANIALTVRGKTGIREVVASGPRVREGLGLILKRRRKDLTDESSDIFKLDEVPDDSYVFCDKKGQPINSFKKSFATFLNKIGLTKDTFGRPRTIYSLRHTYATSRLETGINPYTLAKNMGTSVAMLEEYYGHTTNVGMVDELTKPKIKRTANTGKDGSGLDWL
jgi:integrase